MTEPEWITVSEYALRRRISERQARRIVAALPQELRSAPDARPAKVAWCPATGKMSGNVSGAPQNEAPNYDQNYAEGTQIGPDQPRPGADRWHDGPADVRQDVRQASDAQYEALAATLAILQEQLAKKDAQIADKEAQLAKQADKISELTDQQAATIRELTALADHAQQLHGRDQLERAALKQAAPPRRPWWQTAIAAWRDPRIEQ